MTIKTYIFNILIWLDQGLNVLTGGDPDNTVSSRVGFSALLGSKGAIVLEKIINGLFFDREHCVNAIEWDITRRRYNEELVSELEKIYKNK